MGRQWVKTFRYSFIGNQPVQNFVLLVCVCVCVCMCVCVCVTCSVVANSLQPHGLQPTRLLCPRDFPDKDTGVGCHFLFQGIFPTQGSNPGLLHCRQILYQLSYKGDPCFTSCCAEMFSTFIKIKIASMC